jgi:vacuolar-type H+-ATPase subunit D/Vma8
MTEKPDLITEKLAEIRQAIETTNQNISTLELKRDALVGLTIALERRTRRRNREPLFDRKRRRS